MLFGITVKAANERLADFTKQEIDPSRAPDSIRRMESSSSSDSESPSSSQCHVNNWKERLTLDITNQKVKPSQKASNLKTLPNNQMPIKTKRGAKLLDRSYKAAQ